MSMVNIPLGECTIEHFIIINVALKRVAILNTCVAPLKYKTRPCLILDKCTSLLYLSINKSSEKTL